MKDNFEQVYQFKLSIKGITPQIWRRIQVPENYTFLDLHNATQAVMDWEDYHLHEFEVLNPMSGKPERIVPKEDDFDVFDEEPLVLEKKASISSYFTPENKTALYRYDFGDNWEVKIRFEKILLRKEGEKYPVCTAGKRASPPEDSGGAGGYMYKLEILTDPSDSEYEDTVEWLGENFNPEYFDVKDISFRA
jgi:Plasmid pRiA4b ORF-3-like protein